MLSGHEQRELADLKAGNQRRLADLTAAGCTINGLDIRYLTKLLEAVAGEELVEVVRLAFEREMGPLLDQWEAALREARSRQVRTALATPGPIPREFGS